eukprot:SAG31_NODE_825_length_11760_cov_5.637767_3_plen_148_part_00
MHATTPGRTYINGDNAEGSMEGCARMSDRLRVRRPSTLRVIAGITCCGTILEQRSAFISRLLSVTKHLTISSSVRLLTNRGLFHRQRCVRRCGVFCTSRPIPEESHMHFVQQSSQNRRLLLLSSLSAPISIRTRPSSRNLLSLRTRR